MNKNIIRIGIFDIHDVLPYVFSKEIRHKMKKAGFDYRSKEWKSYCKRVYNAVIDGRDEKIEVNMGSHRYQLFLEKGIKCVECGVEGKYFGLERGLNDNPNTYHFNLYGINKSGKEILLTKDHIVPRSKGGVNKMSNYQTMCSVCNLRKADKC